jgi:hypothetical protein
LCALSRADKLRLIEVLAGDLAREEQALPLDASAVYPVWTPIDAFEAAAVLERELEKQKGLP